jgi:hypothetical protein
MPSIIRCVFAASSSEQNGSTPVRHGRLERAKLAIEGLAPDVRADVERGVGGQIARVDLAPALGMVAGSAQQVQQDLLAAEDQRSLPPVDRDPVVRASARRACSTTCRACP